MVVARESEGGIITRHGPSVAKRRFQSTIVSEPDIPSRFSYYMSEVLNSDDSSESWKINESNTHELQVLFSLTEQPLYLGSVSAVTRYR